jgi:hypothetical protein
MRPHTAVSSHLYICVSSHLYTGVLIPEVLVVPDNLTDPLTCIRQHTSACVAVPAGFVRHMTLVLLERVWQMTGMARYDARFVMPRMRDATCHVCHALLQSHMTRMPRAYGR